MDSAAKRQLWMALNERPELHPGILLIDYHLFREIYELALPEIGIRDGTNWKEIAVWRERELIKAKENWDQKNSNRSRPPNMAHIKAVLAYKQNHTWNETDDHFRKIWGTCKQLIRRAKEKGYISDM
jgi:hypothetical protein